MEEEEREREINKHECQAWISKRWLTYNDLYVNPSPVQIKASVWSQHAPTTYVVHPLLNSYQTMISRGISGYPNWLIPSYTYGSQPQFTRYYLG